MEFAVWKDSLLIGIEPIDKEHRALFALVNRLHQAMVNARGREEAEMAINELESYAESHFKREETLLTAKNYPGLARHKEIHAAFAGKVKEFRAKQANGNGLVSIEMLKFLRQWLEQHIGEDDRQYKIFLDKTAS